MLNSNVSDQQISAYTKAVLNMCAGYDELDDVVKDSMTNENGVRLTKEAAEHMGMHPIPFINELLMNDNEDCIRALQVCLNKLLLSLISA